MLNRFVPARISGEFRLRQNVSEYKSNEDIYIWLFAHAYAWSTVDSVAYRRGGATGDKLRGRHPGVGASKTISNGEKTELSLFLKTRSFFLRKIKTKNVLKLKIKLNSPLGLTILLIYAPTSEEKKEVSCTPTGRVTLNVNRTLRYFISNRSVVRKWYLTNDWHKNARIAYSKRVFRFKKKKWKNQNVNKK